MTDTREIIMSMYKDYQARDLGAVLSKCKDSMCFVWNAGEAMQPFCGECHGKAAFVEKLQSIDADWEVVQYKPVELICEGNSAAGRVQIKYRNKNTGNVLESEIGHFWQLEDGQATKLVEFYDTATVMAVMH